MTPDSIPCGDSLTCPGGTTCLQLTDPDVPLCATSDQLEACKGLDDGAACMLGGSMANVCRNGACIAIECGNLHLDPGEICDDGNTVTGDGTCAADCVSNETCGNGVVDPLVLVNGEKRPNELCDDGNLTSGDGCSSTCTLEVMSWTRVDQAIPALYRHAMTYDSDRRRIVVFGGFFRSAIGDDRSNDEVYEWTGVSWTHVPTTLAPVSRTGHAMAYDPIRHRTVLFGGTVGQTDGEIGDTWEWDGTRWERKAPVVSPPRRSGAVMVFDGTRKKVVLFGGGLTDAGDNDTWEWDGSTWAEIVTSTRPGVRREHVMAFDPERGVIVVAGGRSGGTPVLDTWELQGTTWRSVTTAPAPAPMLRYAALAYDPAGHRMLGYAGTSLAMGSNAETYAYDGTSWTTLSDASPGDRRLAVLATDWANRAVYMFGGDTASGLTDTTWKWDGTLSTWSEVTPFVMPPRAAMSIARDPQRGVVWMFGGHDASKTDTATLVAFDGASFREYVDAGPSARSLAGLAYDRKQEQLVMFGGATTPITGTATMAPAETWIFDGTAWSSPSTATTPPARHGAGMVYDPKRERVVMFGGKNSSNVSLGDTWEWDGTNWTQINVTGPSGRWLSMVEYDEARGAVVLYGGLLGNQFLDDMWSYDGTWKLVVDSTPLAPRVLATLAYEPGTKSLVMYSGLPGGGVPLGDTWAWNGMVWSELLTADEPPTRASGSLFTAPEGVGAYLFGGIENYDDIGVPTYSDVWRLRLDSDARHELCDLAIDNDGDGRSGCDDADCWARCTPACPPGVTCDPSAPRCGDTLCNADLESHRNCPGDCAVIPVCGDAFCDAPETMTSCPGDCTP